MGRLGGSSEVELEIFEVSSASGGCDGSLWLAERVGFVPVDGAILNDLGLNSIARNSQNSQNPGSRYKTGTVNCGWETHPRAGRVAICLRPEGWQEYEWSKPCAPFE